MSDEKVEKLKVLIRRRTKRINALEEINSHLESQLSEKREQLTNAVKGDNNEL